MIDVTPLTAALRGAALCLGATHPDTPLEFTALIDGKCRMTVRCAADADALEARAVELERAARRDLRTNLRRGLDHVVGPLRWDRPGKSAGYSAAVAQRFLDEGERDNYDAYCALYA